MNQDFMKIILFAGILLFLTLPGSSYAFGLAKVNVKVTDEEGVSLSNTKVRVRFSSGTMPKINYTDDQGNCSITSISGDGVVVGTAIKEGYYNTTFHHDFYVTRFGMWQPWGKKFNVVMRPIVNPVPMYVLDMGMKFPAFGNEVGFDLEKADWVTPYGQGTHPDFIFKVERRYDNTDNYEVKMTLTFPNPFDGIQVVQEDEGGDFNAGSSFRLPRMAPEVGYQSKLQRRQSRGSYGRYNDGFNDNNNFIFRVRSEVDENGKLTRATYGKIRGDLNIYGSGAVGMLYYFNPDYTPNLEFDVERNLFSPLQRGTYDVKMP